MDEVKAKEWEAKFRGQAIDGWTIETLIDHGKSAAVFKAVSEGHGKLAALKIFDDELIQRYGDETQLKRIGRELSLKGQNHANMVGILGGGFHEESSNHYIVMDYLDGPSLSKCLTKVPEGNIPGLIEQLVSACEFLEAHELAHRDIKPANIVLLEDMSRLVLLDFGVLKPVGEVGLTDTDGQRLFVGTLQYSSPEFLLRDEENDADGWRALAIYQVGAVLHDLIMRRPIFEEFVTPYAALVNAVQHETPSVASEGVPSYLIDACQMALVKSPEKRLALVSWEAFRPPVAASAGDAARQRISKRLLLADAQSEAVVDDGPAMAELLETVIDGLKVELRRIRQANSSIMPPLIVTRGPKRVPVLEIRIVASAEYGLARDVCMEIAVTVIDVEAQAVRLEACASVPSDDAQEPLALVIVFKGPYSSGATSDRVEAAVLVALDQAQNGTIGQLSLVEVGVD
ncbi:protein kinase [Sphingomonas ginsenosidivorax]|uniref:Protein kinase n=1 Tax=Sphingomonas ginsenosidivorax TaxID=862135 RepID=A0A5C6UE60_9SPHN|nr:protein kinase [Sphingomonas ginsenosidivorax]TXC70969.1 protein kinase [Sphingomonas ginsenosidivorax]